MPSTKRLETKQGVSYKVTVSLGYDGSGKKIKKTTTYYPDQTISARQQEKDAKKFADEFEENLKNGISYDGDKILFEDFALQWLEFAKNEITYNTYKSYGGMLKNKIIPYFKNYKLSKIRLSMIESFYLSLAADYSHATIKRCDIILNGIFERAYRYKMVLCNPRAGAKIPKTKKKTSKLKFFTPQQSLTFLSSLNMEFDQIVKGHQRIDDTGKPYTVRDYIERKSIPTQFKVFFNIAVLCGLRRGEILALHWSDIDFKERLLSVKCSVSPSEEGAVLKDPKTKSSIRKISIPEQLIPLLTKYQTEYDILRINLGDKWAGTGNMFIQADGKLMGIHTPYQRFVSHLQRYNEWVETANNDKSFSQSCVPLPMIPLHGLRHSCATLMNYLKVNIIDIAKILGHAQTSTTMNIYAHSFEEQNRDASDRIDDFLRKHA